MKTLTITAFSAVTALLNALSPACADALVSRQTTGEYLAIQNLTDNHGTVEGVLVNKSPHTVEDVKLLISHEWLWANEFSPGTDNPSRADFITLDHEIPAGGSVPFTYTPALPLPERNDGHFIAYAKVTGLTVHKH